MKAIDKATNDFREQIANGELVMFKYVEPGEPWDTIAQNSAKKSVLFKRVEPGEDVPDNQILSFVGREKWDKMMTQNILKEKYIEFLSKQNEMQ